MYDLNEMFLFVDVVENQGFAAAGRALGMPKSKISRRIAQLEERLGIRLINRSTRRFSVTDLGQEYYHHCRAMVVEAEAAEELVARRHSEPCGTVGLLGGVYAVAFYAALSTREPANREHQPKG